MSEPTNEPTTFRAGDSVTWSRQLPDYLPSDGWALKYKLLWPTGSSVAINAAADGENHKVTLTSTSTANWAAGTATLVAWVEHADGSRATLEQQAVTILPDLTVAANHDTRTQNQKGLADAKAALAAYMEKGQIHVAEYDIGGRTMKFRTADEITKLINYYEAEVARERTLQAIAEGGSPGRVRVRF